MSGKQLHIPLDDPREKISETVGLSQNRVSEIIGNANFGNIDNLLSHGRDMEYIAGHYHMNLPLARPPRLSPPQADDGGQVWALRLEGKTDQEKFIKSFLILVHKNTKETTMMVFLNADWPPARRARF